MANKAAMIRVAKLRAAVVAILRAESGALGVQELAEKNQIQELGYDANQLRARLEHMAKGKNPLIHRHKNGGNVVFSHKEAPTKSEPKLNKETPIAIDVEQRYLLRIGGRVSSLKHEDLRQLWEFLVPIFGKENT
jgi:hypothetical protein